MKKIIGIWAQTENGIIGKDQVMPWHLPAELQHFKETTMGQAILMGRVTFDGMKKRVLPGRTSIILTQDQAYDPEMMLYSSCTARKKSWSGIRSKRRIFMLLEAVRF